MRRTRLLVLVGTAAGLIVAACSSFEGDSGTPPVSLEAGADADRDAGTTGISDAATTDADPCPNVDFSSDPHHCGTCGHDCLGGACEAGVCGVYRAATPDVNVGAIAVTSSGIYWTDGAGSSIHGCPPVGCPDGGAKTLAAPGGQLNGLVAVGEDVVTWTVNSMFLVSTPNGSSKPLGNPNEPKSVAATGESSFAFVQSPGGQSAAYRYADGSFDALGHPLLTIPSITGFDSNVFLYTAGVPEGIVACELGNLPCSAPRPLFGAAYKHDPDVNTRLAATSDSVFLFQPDQKRLAKCASTGCDAPSDLGSIASMSSFAVDEKFVYFTTSSPGTLERCPHAGCGAEQTRLQQDVFTPHGLLVTANAVYWATDANAAIPAAIWRIAR